MSHNAEAASVCESLGFVRLSSGTPACWPRSAPLFLAPGTFPGFALGGAQRLGSQTAARSGLQSLNLSASRIANRNTQPQAAKCSRARIHPSRESPSP